MHPSIRLLHTCRITLFTRANCSLCTNAKQVLSTVWDKTPFDYTEVDVMKEEGKKWRGFYEFDTPVIHVSNSKDGEESPEKVAAASKLMHQFSAEDVFKKMDGVDAEKGKGD